MAESFYYKISFPDHFADYLVHMTPLGAFHCLSNFNTCLIFNWSGVHEFRITIYADNDVAITILFSSILLLFSQLNLPQVFIPLYYCMSSKKIFSCCPMQLIDNFEFFRTWIHVISLHTHIHLVRHWYEVIVTLNILYLLLKALQ